MKIFEIIYKDGEIQWVAANTNIEALQEVLSTEDTDIDLMEQVKELPKGKWDNLTVKNQEYDTTDSDDWESMTFRDFMKEQKSPAIIAATFYE